MRILSMILVSILCILVTTSTAADYLSITLNGGDYKIVDLEDGLQAIRMNGFGNLLIPGKPMLPAKVFMIALRPGAEVLSVTITGASAVELPGGHKIRPAPALMPASNCHRLTKESIRKWQENYDHTYSSDAVYPEQPGQYLGTGGLRKYTSARVAFFPFAYHPKSQRLLFYPRCDVTISYSIPQGVEAEKLKQLLFDAAADDRASRLFVNYSEARHWYAPNGKGPEKQTYDYIIITTEALRSSVSPLVSWKQYIGYSVNVITTEWISDHYFGVDLEEQIRNFLIDKYAEWGIEYVLLVGNIDLVPMRYCFIDSTNHDPSSEYCTPTDYYYADLTGDWDSDGDGFYGECGQDDVDFVPEVFVGRIPWKAEVRDICQKIVDFERDTGHWKGNVLLLGAMSNYANEDHSGMLRTDGAELMEEMIADMLSGCSYTTMYEKKGLNPCPYSCDLPLTHANVVDNWSTNDYGIVNWWAHGTNMDAWRLWWAWDDGDGVPEYSELYWDSFLENADAHSLDDEHPSIIFSCSCDNGRPEVNSLARELIKYGSVSIVAATRTSWYAEGWQDESDGDNGSMDYYFFHYLINENERVGDALYDSKIYYLNHFFWGQWECQQNMLAFCLYGDPALIREVSFPIISLYDYEWRDSGGDEHAEPGDTLSLTVSIVNSGKRASTVEANLYSTNPFITMIDSSSSYGEILGDSIEDNSDDPFIIEIDENAPLHICTLNVAIMADSLNFSAPLFIMIGIPPVLVIDDDGGDSYETYFTRSLDRVGVLFDLKDTEEDVPSSYMLDYQALIWLTGDNSSPLDSSDVLTLSNYLSSGGNLFITGQDVEGCGDTSFYHNNLHATVVEDSADRHRIFGVKGDLIGNDLGFFIAGASGAFNQVTPSIISPIGGADSSFTYWEGGACGVRYGDSCKVVYLSFGFEAITPLWAADTVMVRILKWFDLAVGMEERVVWQKPSGITDFLKIQPNPFKGELQIEYFVENASVAELRIYDAAGRMVREILRDQRGPGVYQVKWDGRDNEGSRLPSGVYFCRMAIRSIRSCGAIGEAHTGLGTHTARSAWTGLRREDFSSTKKMVLLR